MTIPWFNHQYMLMLIRWRRFYDAANKTMNLISFHTFKVFSGDGITSDNIHKRIMLKVNTSKMQNKLIQSDFMQFQ